MITVYGHTSRRCYSVAFGDIQIFGDTSGTPDPEYLLALGNTTTSSHTIDVCEIYLFIDIEWDFDFIEAIKCVCELLQTNDIYS